MKYNAPTGSSDPNAPYVGRNLTTGQQGSRVPPAAAEHPQREIVAVIEAAGLTPSPADLTQLLQAMRTLFPKRTTINPILYVRTDGNDTTGDGSANTAGKAFATIAAAIAYGMRNFYLTAGQYLIIQLGNAGTYAAPGDVMAPAQIRGDPVNPQNYVVAGAGSSALYALVHATGADVSTDGISIQNNGTSSNSAGSGNGKVLTLQNTRFLTSNGNVPALISTTGGSVNVGGGVVAAGGAQSLFYANGGAISLLENFVISGTMSYPNALARITSLGRFNLRAAGITVTGTVVSTPRFLVELNSVINVLGAGVNYFPGTAAGGIVTGGQYA